MDSDGRHGRNPLAANLKLSPRTLALPLSLPLASEREALDARLEEIEANLLLRLEAKLQQRQHSEPAPLDEERVQSLIAADLDVYNEHVMALIHAHAERGQQQAAQRRSVSEAELWEARGEVCLTYLAHLEDKVASLTAMLKDKEAFEAQILEMKEDVRRRQSELEDELRAAKAEIESQRRCQRQTDDKIRTLELELERERHQHMLSKTQGEVDRVELQYVCNSHEGLERQIDTLQVKLAGEVEARVRCQALLSHLEGARQTDGQAGAWRSGTGETQEGLRDAAEREKKREREREELQTMRKRVHDAQEALKMLRCPCYLFASLPVSPSVYTLAVSLSPSRTSEVRYVSLHSGSPSDSSNRGRGCVRAACCMHPPLPPTFPATPLMCRLANVSPCTGKK